MSTLANLCVPAMIYFWLSIFSLLVILTQNINNVTEYCVLSYSCPVESTSMVFVVKLIYILFWTWVMNFFCQKSFTAVSWALLLFPYILMIALIAVFVASSGGHISMSVM